MKSLNQQKLVSQDDHWIPLSDLMTGLMMVFLLVAIVYMVKVEADSQLVRAAGAKTREIAVQYRQISYELYEDLRREFENDLARWDAELLSDSTVRFRSPEVLFDTGRADLKQPFKEILDSFFPRYVAILASEKYRSSIQEIRIEGHTSSRWDKASSEHDKYFQNLRLSQDRTRSTVEYVMRLQSVQDRLQWLRERLTANGLSYSKRILNADGSENSTRSQRVEFRVRTDADVRMQRIIETAIK